MRRLALAATLALAVSFTALPGGASAAVPRNFYGIVPSTPLVSSDFARMGGAKVGTLRTGASWVDLQAAPTAGFNFAALDATVRSAAFNRIQLLPILAFEPSFVTGPCGSDQGCQRHIYISSAREKSAWVAYVTSVVQRYGPGGSFWQQNPGVPYEPVRRWQIWNEQNAENQKNSPKLYSKLLALSDNAISAVDPGAKIILGGMFGTPKGGLTAWKYLSKLYASGAKKHFDAVALHPYAPTIDGIAFQIKKIRSVMKAHHDPKGEVDVTEISWGSSLKKHPGTGALGATFNVGPKRQAKRLKQSFKLLTSHRSSWNIGGVYWFGWKDPRNPPPGLCAFCYSSGLYKSNGTSAKPSLRAYKRFTNKTH
jgi:hypothetical protein